MQVRRPLITDIGGCLVGTVNCAAAGLWYTPIRHFMEVVVEELSL